MHLLQIIDSLAWGGAQKLLVTLAETLEGDPEHQLAVVSLTHKPTDAPFEQELRDLGVHVEHFRASNLINAKRVNKLASFIRQEKFDLIHNHLTYANILGTLAGKMTGTPAVASIHNIKRDHQPAAVQKIEDYILNHWAKRIIAVGHIVADINKDHYPKIKLDIIPNAVPLIPSISAEQARVLRQELIGDPERPLILSVGRFTPQKAYDDLIKAFAQVHQNIPEAALLIIGGGGEREALEALVNSLELQEHVFMPGRRSDVPQLMAMSDLFVSSSHWEGLPVVVLEAMSAALPVVATAAGDVPKVVTEDTGIVVPIQEIDTLAQAIEQFMKNPEKRAAAGRAARQRVIDHYSPQVWRDHMFTLYREVLGIA